MNFHSKKNLTGSQGFNAKKSLLSNAGASMKMSNAEILKKGSSSKTNTNNFKNTTGGMNTKTAMLKDPEIKAKE